MKQRTLLLILVLLSALTASAYDAEIDGVYYDFDTSTMEATVTGEFSVGYGVYTGNVTIPETVAYNGVNYSVTAIGEGAFAVCDDLKSVTIPNSVTAIGDYVFSGCYGLTDVYCYAERVPTTDRDAFYNSPISSATLHVPGASVYTYKTTEPWNGFGTIVAITYYNFDTSTMEATVTSGKYTGNVTIPETVAYNGVNYSVTAIGDYAFSGCSGLTSVTIPNSVTSIGDFAFIACSSLTSVTIPNSVTAIGVGAFASCSSLTSVTIPNSVTAIREDAFYRCSGLTSVIIGNSVTSIESAAFRNCSGLTSVIIGNSVTSIESDAFYDCSGLTDVYCYAEVVPTTNDYAFYNSSISSATLHVPAASIDAYKKTSPWNDFGTIVALSMNGDVNGDGTTDLTDAIMIVYHSLGQQQEGFNEVAADVNSDGNIDLTDAIIVVYKSLGVSSTKAPRKFSSAAEEGDKLIISDITIPQGGTVEVPLDFTAAEDGVNVGFTMNLVLPEGISTVKDEDGVPEYEQNSSVLKKFTVITTENDGFAAIPQTTSAAIKGTEGTLLTFQLKADEALEVGTKLTAKVTKAAFTAKDAEGKMSTVSLDDFTFNITVDNPTGMERPTPDPSRNGGEWASAVYDLSGRSIINGRSAQGDASHLKKSVNCKLPKGIYIKNGKKVVVK